ncbi:serine/threonine-protein phosphatase 4 regulatory subunit 1 [Acrasis kona]|uniref:Serine/threonine-protein phosphatase 4 regulatory subunit 1 n=1 Tax=Acrasis kona TaxID=1008807 RepID=A0AAW2YZZ2_9EUKA
MYNNEDVFDEDDFIFNEYTIDDTLDSLSRLEKYYNSDFSLQRLVLVRDVYDTAVEAGYKESVKRLLPLLTNFVSDTEPVVRQVFADQLHSLATFFLEVSKSLSVGGGDSGYNELINTFIPYTFELIIDKNTEVGQSATEALVKIASLIKREHIEPQLLSVILNLAHDDRVEEYRIAAAKLFNELAPVFGDKLCREVVVQEVIYLSDDPSLLVRKTVSQHLGKICNMIGTESTVDKILPVFMLLSKDEIWGVRKACSESIPEISKCVTQEVRATQLVELFERSAEDVSRWVKREAYKQLGAFIATFSTDQSAAQVPDSLIQYFSDMAFQNDQNESDMVEYCAYNFPAVVATVGPSKWPQLEEAYNHLVKDAQWKVRRSLGCSLHEVARIVGTEISERTLTSAFELFLKDLDEVKIGMIGNLAKFVQVLSDDVRAQYLPVICAIPEQTDNWRIRSEVSQQLGYIAELIPAEMVREKLLKVLYELYNDAFAEVRKKSIVSCGKVLKRLCEGDEQGKIDFLQFLHGLAQGNFHKRLIFVYACEFLLKEIDPELFLKEFVPELINLTQDKVPNIRIAVAAFTKTHAMQNETLRESPQVQDLYSRLSQDADRDVKFYALSSSPTSEQVKQTEDKSHE